MNVLTLLASIRIIRHFCTLEFHRCPPKWLLIYLSIYVSFFLSFLVSIYLCFSDCFDLSIYLSICLFVCVLWHINLCRLFNAKSILISNNRFYFKPFSLAWVLTLIVKNISISSNSVWSSKTIQYIMSIFFVYTLLNVKTVLFQAIQFSVSTVSMSKTVHYQRIQFSINTQFKYQNSFISSNFKTTIQFSSIWSIHTALSGARVDLVVMTIKGYSAFPKAPALLEPYHQIV